MTFIADIWLKLKSIILEILIVTNITDFDSVVHLTLVLSETSILS